MKKHPSAQSKMGIRIIIASVALVVFGAAYIGYSGYSKTLEPFTQATAESMLQPAAGAANAQTHNHGDHAPATPADPKAAAALLQITADDLVMGSASAPVTLMEYASLSCPHCAHFHSEILPAIKKQFVDTGKARFVFRHFPLNAPAMRAAMAVQCAPTANRLNLLGTYFTTQKDWAFSSRYGSMIAEIAKKHGLARDAFDACMKNTTLENAVLASRQNATTLLNVQATPTLFVNGVALKGTYDVQTIAKAVADASQPAAKP
jgi:protein-disulfide isomerase